MSQTAQPRDESTADIPEMGVRNTTGTARRLHRQDPDCDEPTPACYQADYADEFTDVHIPSHLPFDRWDLCQNDPCFPDAGKVDQ